MSMRIAAYSRSRAMATACSPLTAHSRMIPPRESTSSATKRFASLSSASSTRTPSSPVSSTTRDTDRRRPPPWWVASMIPSSSIEGVSGFGRKRSTPTAFARASSSLPA